MKKLSDHCRECKPLAEKLKEVVLSADFKSHMFPSGTDKNGAPKGKFKSDENWMRRALNEQKTR